MVFRVGRRGTSGSDLLWLLSVGAPAVGGRHRNINRGSRKEKKDPPRPQKSARSALRPRGKTHPRGEYGGSPHSESTPRPKSDLKNKRLTPTILTTLRSLGELELNARLYPCFRRLPSAPQRHVCGCVAQSSTATWPSGFGPDPRPRLISSSRPL